MLGLCSLLLALVLAVCGVDAVASYGNSPSALVMIKLPDMTGHWQEHFLPRHKGPMTMVIRVNVLEAENACSATPNVTIDGKPLQDNGRVFLWRKVYSYDRNGSQDDNGMDTLLRWHAECVSWGGEEREVLLWLRLMAFNGVPLALSQQRPLSWSNVAQERTYSEDWSQNDGDVVLHLRQTHPVRILNVDGAAGVAFLDSLKSQKRNAMTILRTGSDSNTHIRLPHDTHPDPSFHKSASMSRQPWSSIAPIHTLGFVALGLILFVVCVRRAHRYWRVQRCSQHIYSRFAEDDDPEDGTSANDSHDVELGDRPPGASNDAHVLRRYSRFLRRRRHGLHDGRVRQKVQVLTQRLRNTLLLFRRMPSAPPPASSDDSPSTSMCRSRDMAVDGIFISGSIPHGIISPSPSLSLSPPLPPSQPSQLSRPRPTSAGHASLANDIAEFRLAADLVSHLVAGGRQRPHENAPDDVSDTDSILPPYTPTS